MKLKFFGFYKEHGSNNEPSVFDVAREVLTPDEKNAIAVYLSDSPFIVATLDYIESAFGDGKFVGSSTILTDGEWCWPEYFSYYFVNHDIAAPKDFLNKVRRVGYRPVNKESLDFPELENALIEQLSS